MVSKLIFCAEGLRDLISMCKIENSIDDSVTEQSIV